MTDLTWTTARIVGAQTHLAASDDKQIGWVWLDSDGWKAFVVGLLDVKRGLPDLNSGKEFVRQEANSLGLLPF